MAGSEDPPPRHLTPATAAAAAATSVAAFLLFRTTMLPGVDFGDTASFQAIVGAPGPRPRDAYPLYFALGKLSVWVLGAATDPARALNVLSVLCGAAACGTLTVVCAFSTASVAGGMFAGLLLASSYTFWSQAVIAEVYALHVVLIGACLAAALAYAACPTVRVLTVFFVLYAVSFGNHLAMVLLLPGFAWFLLAVTPGGSSGLVTPRVAGAACLALALGAAQYAWNAAGLWAAPDAPASLGERLAALWFDVTKSDWRETIVGTIPAGRVPERFAMWWFDLRQQYGIAGLALGSIGMVWLWRRNHAVAVMLAIHWLIASAFALSYNVGDAHVFFLPAHAMLAIAAGCGAAAIVSLARSHSRNFSVVIGCALIAYPAYRIWDIYPVLDRSRDVRPVQVLAELTAGLTSREVFVTALPWEVQNGLDYYAHYEVPEIVHVTVRDVLPHFAFLLWDNEAIGRRITVTTRARDEILAAYGTLVVVASDARVQIVPIDRWTAGALPYAYVLSALTPVRGYTVDRAALDRLARRLSGGSMPAGSYAVIAGRSGRRPAVSVGQDRPFRLRSRLDAHALDIRMESWLTFDQFRRAGFGHVVANRRHLLTIERGVSYVELDRSGQVVRTRYAANIFAPQARYQMRSSR